VCLSVVICLCVRTITSRALNYKFCTLTLWVKFEGKVSHRSKVLGNRREISCRYDLDLSRYFCVLAASAKRQRYPVRNISFPIQLCNASYAYKICASRSGARFTKYHTTILRLSYDNGKVTIDLRRTSNLQNILRKAQGFS